MNKKIFWGICIAIIVYLLYSFVSAFFKLNPYVSTIFEKGVQLEYEQKLTDSIIFFHTENGETVRVNLKKNTENTFHFWSAKSISSIEEIDVLNERLKKDFYVLTKDSVQLVDSVKRNNEIKFDIYYYETNNLPFKYKKIDILPYTITIKEGIVENAYLGEIKKQE